MKGRVKMTKKIEEFQTEINNSKKALDIHKMISSLIKELEKLGYDFYQLTESSTMIRHKRDKEV